MYMIRVRVGSWFELDRAGCPNHSMAARHVVLAERKLTTYVYAVANLSGWDSRSIRPESKLIKEIVKDIEKKLEEHHAAMSAAVIGGVVAATAASSSVSC
ncbi:hypothetical protein TIFTF001_040237 [Ficus carica]|uniref:TIR domain-containing protein n=1 Tax=Ficus carica TaxID=3494 RepID=A0AA87YT22_FICCA|nr:hypothetical protein TIFTF001_040230 [Ficus carica]GMN22351.1 hypothetical protein TIFTF001_040237 [Ficus carica]